MDVALAIEAICPAAEYFGVTNDNTEEQYDSLDWRDLRVKPTWAELQIAWDSIPSETELQAAKAAAAASAVSKLEAIGLTSEEIAALRA